MRTHPRASPLERAFLRDLAHFRKFGNTPAIREAAETLAKAMTDHLDAVVRTEAREVRK